MYQIVEFQIAHDLKRNTSTNYTGTGLLPATQVGNL